ncbi:hypothetical protein OG555_17315 [Kribbella sp. NBC_01484]|uniref:hypothetical protein n=1 Tax=Kribbella sp. NBC_01484 TaxID=2903579 RepID=UPI002E2FC416|nr:hypothetical protein [Kribbella sp. NBC_01484]
MTDVAGPSNVHIPEARAKLSMRIAPGSDPTASSMPSWHISSNTPRAWGTSDVAGARIRASDESVDPKEIERMIDTQALLLQSLATGR